MGILFTYHGLTYASIPRLPLTEGELALVVSSSVGFIDEGLHWRRHVGRVEDVCRPGTAHHYWWRYKHGPQYVQPRPRQTVIQLTFDDGDTGLFLERDLLHVSWLSFDVHPDVLPAHLFFPPS